MFVIPYNTLLESLKLERTSLDSGADVHIPGGVLKFLLQCLLTCSDFDAESYLRNNPDILGLTDPTSPKAVQLHFIRQGYFEGRLGGSPKLDESWYLERYPDVAQAVKDGIVKSAADHYQENGGLEWRAPNPDVAFDVEAWREVLEGGSDTTAVDPPVGQESG
jgi:hypothetical protein